MNLDVHILQRQLGVNFHQLHLLHQAFTHSSYAHEHRLSNPKDNERLEFLGDAVLSLMISAYLYQHYPEYSEGVLTKMRASIVCEPSLVKFAEKLEFAKFVRLGRGEELTGGRNRPALLADVFESFVGALFLDQGLDAVKTFMEKHIFPQLGDQSQYLMIDYKTILQEHIQNRNLGVVEYRIVDERGPSHDREFVSEVFTANECHGQGVGRTKKEAEQQAASQALRKLQVSV